MVALDPEAIRKALEKNKEEKMVVKEERIELNKPVDRERLIVRQTCLKASAEIAAHQMDGVDTESVLTRAQAFEEWVFR